jgi:hypothetical protein
VADLDAELGSRLARLAESVPVAPWLGHVEPSPVAARRQVRMAWVTPLVALAVVVVGVAVLDRPPGPGASGSPDGVVARKAQGPFVLELRSTKARYAPDEPIEMAASLTYLGDGPQVRINHALGPMDGPIAFGTVEPVIAHHRLGTIWATACHGTELRRGEPLTIPFAKGGFVMNADEPGAAEFMGYLQDPVLRLPAGTWHPYALAEFALGGCGSDEVVTIRTSLEITVDGPTPEPTARAAATMPSSGVVHASTTDGSFMLEIESPKARYLPGEPIDLAATLRYLGTRPIELWVPGGSPLAFGIVEPVNGLTLSPSWRLSCTPMDLVPKRSIEQAFTKSGGFDGDDPRAVEWRAFFDEPELFLPEGTWHPYVQATFSVGECGSGDVTIRAQIEIEVRR